MALRRARNNVFAVPTAREKRYEKRLKLRDEKKQVIPKRKRKDLDESDKENQPVMNRKKIKPQIKPHKPQAAEVKKRRVELDQVAVTPDQLLQIELEKWPRELLRFTYCVFPRQFFGALKFLANGGLGAVLTSSLSTLGICHRDRVVDNFGTPRQRQRKTRARTHADQKRSTRFSENGKNIEVVLKVCLDSKDWNDEITGYYNNRGNPGIVPIMGVVLLPAAEVDKLCKDILDYIPRQEGWVPTMMFERWDGSLHDAMEKGLLEQWGPVALLEALMDFARAVAGFHTAGSLHRDVKPKNVLYKIEEDGSVRAALCDLGLATSYAHTLPGRAEMTQEVGSEEYMAPEVKYGTQYSTPADIFSMAITINEIICSCEAIRSKIEPLLSPFIQNALSENPDQRPSAKEFVAELAGIRDQLQEELHNS